MCRLSEMGGRKERVEEGGGERGAMEDRAQTLPA
jgi:hypothetical protein